MKATRDSSALSKGICGVWPNLLRGLTWVIGNGKSVRFWLDSWVENERPLIKKATAAVSDVHFLRKVAEYVDEDGQWLWQDFVHVLPANTCLKIAAINPPNRAAQRDVVVWGRSPNGCFTTKSAYELIEESCWTELNKNWMALWKGRGPQRIRSFLWLALHNKLLTNENHFKRHIAASPNCVRCLNKVE